MSRTLLVPLLMVIHTAAVGGCTNSSLLCGAGTHESSGSCVPNVDGAVPPDSGRPGADAGDGGDVGDGGVADGGDAGALPNGIFELQGVSESLPTDDLAALDAIVGDASIVALGESVHTSGGYSRAKFRLFKYLVETHGFRLYGFESPWPEAEAVGRYVETCEGDPRTAIGEGLFGVWANRSVLELVEWMCGWNRAHSEDPVAFFGFDVQQPWDDGPALRAYLTRSSPAEAVTLNAGIDGCSGVNAGTFEGYYRAVGEDPSITPADHAECTRGLDAVAAHLADHRAALAAATSELELEMAEVRLIGVRSWEASVYYSWENTAADSDDALSFEGRDRGMAEVFDRLRRLRYGNAKAVIWAHNTHIAANQDRVVGYFGTGRSMGTFLREAHGDDYVPIGLIGYRVSINWPGVEVGELPPPTAFDSVEVLLHGLGRSTLLVDLDFPGAITPFLEPGTAYNLQDEHMVPREQFDGLLFLDESPGMESLF